MNVYFVKTTIRGVHSALCWERVSSFTANLTSDAVHSEWELLTNDGSVIKDIVCKCCPDYVTTNAVWLLLLLGEKYFSKAVAFLFVCSPELGLLGHAVFQRSFCRAV